MKVDNKWAEGVGKLGKDNLIELFKNRNLTIIWLRCQSLVLRKFFLINNFFQS